MEENKNLEPEVTETEPEVTENAPKVIEIETAGDTESSEPELEEKTEEKPIDGVLKKQKKEKKITVKNQFLLKKGGYSVAITAIVLAAIIVFNILVGALSDRFVLDYDFSKEKKNSLSSENVDYIKKIDNDVTVYFCSDEESYSSYMSYYAQGYGVQNDASDYYAQTIKIVKKYAEYNKKIKLSFVDTQSSEFTAISSKYTGESITYGDIVVSAVKNGNEKHKVIGFKDIYTLEEDSTYASMGYTTQNITGNDIENALTRAISYVVSDKQSKIALITGHTVNTEALESYKKLLTDNNFEVTEISDKVIKSIPDEYNAVAIVAPGYDFMGSEITVLSEFLDNNGKLGKGLVCFADVSSKYLKNFYAFLEEWGISAEDGILYETSENNYMPEDGPTTFISRPLIADEGNLTTDMLGCITGNNVPLTAAFEKQEDMAVTSFMQTPETTIAVPKGTGAGFKDAGKYEGKSYSTAIQSKKTTYVDGTDEANSYVTVFSSTDFLISYYANYDGVANKNLALKCTERIGGTEDNSGISFITKSIADESFADSVTQSSSNIIRIIFMFILPFATLIAGVIVFLKRRNA